MEDKVIKLGGKKKLLMRHISKAKEYVQGTTFMEVDMQHVKECRKTVKASYTSYIVHATAQALKEAPLLNTAFVEEQLMQRGNINLGVAVDVDGQLIVPVIKNADQLAVDEIDKKIKELKAKAEENKLTMEDISDGTFTVTNSGVFGSSFFTPIISHPQSAILGIAGIIERPVVRDGEIVIRPICTLCLSYDHRIIEGSVAVKFLASVRDLLQGS